MFNVAVIKLRDVLKYFLALIIMVIIIIFGKKYFNNKFQSINLGQKVSNKLCQYIHKSIELEIPFTNEIQSNNKNTIDENTDSEGEGLESKLLNVMLGLELSAIDIKDDNTKIANENEENKEQKESEKINNNEQATQTQEKIEENKTEEKKENLELAKTDVKTEVVTKNPLAEAYTKNYKGVKIKNETNFELSNDILSTESLKIDKSNIIIFHTHTCESYTSSEKFSYTPTGNYRTTDLKYSVARVGDELTNYLKQYKINVVHNKTYHDYPSYNGSYSRSLKTVTSLLKNTKADIVIDLHRDAIGSNSSYAPTVKVGDDYCAQLMFVMGSNGGGLTHKNWQNNLKFAIKMQEIANKRYPGLFKPIILRNSRYNQHLAKAACIIEVGSTGNTLEQCLNSMKYLAEVINEF